MSYNRIAKFVLRSAEIAPKDIKHLFKLADRELSGSRAGAYFKAEDNPRYYEMNFQTFRDWLLGAALFKGIPSKGRPVNVEECIALINLLVPDLDFSGCKTEQDLMRVLNDHS